MCCNSEVLFVLSNVNLVVYPYPTEAVANTLEGLYQEANKIDIVWNWIGCEQEINGQILRIFGGRILPDAEKQDG